MQEKSSTPKIIYGCMGLGGGWTRDPIGPEEERQANLAIDTALAHGINTFDHADIYGFGKSEIVFGKVLKSRLGLRDTIRIQSKAGICLKTGPNNSNTFNFSREHLEKQVETSLKSLQTDYLDVFLLHRPDPLMDPEEVAETFFYLKNRGLVRSFGVSNMSVMQIQSLQKFWEDPLVANQIQFGLAHTLLLEDGVFVNMKRDTTWSGMGGMLPYAQSNGMELQAWRPLDKGLFMKDAAPGDAPEVLATKALVQAMAEKYETEVTSLLLAWVLKLPCRISAVIGSTQPHRIISAASAMKVNISREDWYKLWLTANNLTLP